jgi:hypothetical protein
MNGDRSDCIRFYEFVKITLPVADTVPAEPDKWNAAALRAPLIERFNRQAGDLGDFFHGEEAFQLAGNCRNGHTSIFGYRGRGLVAFLVSTIQWISCPLGQVRQPNKASARTGIPLGQTTAVVPEELSEAILHATLDLVRELKLLLRNQLRKGQY